MAHRGLGRPSPSRFPFRRPDTVVAPGSSTGIFRGRLVVVFGTGAGSGVFVYSGTPALGNPPIFWATSATVDPYGNVISSTAGVAGTGQFRAGFTIVNSNGIFTYSAAPAANNLAGADCPAQVNDAFGNTALAGKFVYGGAPNAWLAIGIAQVGAGTAAMQWWTSSNANMTGWVQQGLFSPLIGAAVNIQNSGQGFSIGSGGLNHNESVDITGSLLLSNAFASPGGTPGSVTLFADPSTSALTRILPSLYTDRISGAQGDHTRFTVTQTGTNQLTKAWDIPPSDAQNDTHYRLIAWGKGTWGSTLQQLTVNVSGGHAAANTPTGSQTASTNFFWKAILDLHIEVASGVGSATWNLEVNTSEGGAHGYSAHGNTEAGAFNSTIDNTIALFAGWGSTTGAPTITCDGSTFERLGR